MKKRLHSEEELLALIRKIIPSPKSDVTTAIGDDCAVINTRNMKNSLSLLKTDALVEGIHFTSGTSLRQVGWKALCRPISDIAAMGGTPLHALITVAAPPSWGNAEWRSLYLGLGKAAREFQISIVGGETVRSPGPLFLSVALTGTVDRSTLCLRSKALPGDFLCVTGKLGGSFKSGRHLRFQPRLAEGQWLSSQRGVSAMMDLSDGLGSDLPKLANASGCSFRLAPDSLPLHRDCSIQEALCDGEDYELLVCIRPRLWPDLQRRWDQSFPKLPLAVIGTLLDHRNISTKIAAGHDHLHP